MRLVVAALLAVLVAAGPVGADHVDTLYLHHSCVGSEGRHVRADCDVEKQTYREVPAPEGVPLLAAHAGLDARGLILSPLPGGGVPISDVGVAGARPYALLLEVHGDTVFFSDPILDQGEATERRAKRTGFDALESTGLHFRLVCGWDLTQTARTCEFYDPEADAETAVVRRERDVLLEDGHDAAAANAVDLARDVAPSVEARVTVKRIEVGAAVVPTTTPGASPGTTEVEAPPSAVTVAPTEGLTSRQPDDPGPVPFGPPESTEPSVPRHPPSLSTGAFERDAQVLAQVEASRDERSMVAVAVAAVAGGGLVVLFGVLAHRHLTSRNVFGNATRERVYSGVRSRPGSTISDLARAARVNHTTATYHLHVLEEMGLVIAERVGNRKHYFGATDVGNRTARLGLLLEGMGRARELVALLARREVAGPSDLASEVGMTSAGAYWHLRRLESLGVVRRVAPAGAGRARAGQKFCLAEAYGPAGRARGGSA